MSERKRKLEFKFDERSLHASSCEVCGDTETLACGLDGMPELFFCVRHLKEHVTNAHGIPKSKVARILS